MLALYSFTELLGSGSFGDVFKAKDLNSDEFVAIKVGATQTGITVMEREAAIMARLKGVKGTPSLLNHFIYEEKGYLVMELLGKPILEDCQSKQFPVSRAARIVLKVLKVVKRIHTLGFLHRDIKPQNILYGLGRHRHDLYLVDFGLAKAFPDVTEKKNGRRLSRFIGTRLFSSANAFAGNEQSYSDDLEGLCIVLIWLIKQDLPWCHPAGSDYEIVDSKKLTATVKEIAEGCPKEVYDCLAYARELRFGELPNYSFLTRKLKQLKLKHKSPFLRADFCADTSEQTHWRGKKKDTRRSSNPLPAPDVESTPVLKPPEISQGLRQRIKQMHAAFLPLTCTLTNSHAG